MKLNTKSRYAVMAMIDLAQQIETQNEKTCVPLSLIAQRQNLPLQYLEQLFAKLRKSELVKSARGTNGGYELAKPINKIRIYDIIVAADAPVKVTRCDTTSEKGCHANDKRCNSHQLWHELERVMHDYLIQVSLQDVVSGQKRFPMVILNGENS
ncbi:MAG: Rrf2 family transcriptional regulator [Proteobacteria bacterium]|nr:Rrf2 family transcriptional regulator [Pseudomonadota bacterium]